MSSIICGCTAFSGLLFTLHQKEIMSATNEEIPVKLEEAVKEDKVGDVSENTSTQEDSKKQSSATSNLPDPNVAEEINKAAEPVKKEYSESMNDSTKEEHVKQEPKDPAEFNEGKEDTQEASSDPKIETTKSTSNTDTPLANSVNNNIDQESNPEESTSTSNKESENIKYGIVIPKGIKSKKPQKLKKAGLRKGKWTAEEEEYTMRIIQHFRTGLLSLPDGHTLRSYLAEKLNCDPMRITKKFSGASCLGKRVYNLCDRSQVSPHDLAIASAELNALEANFKLRIEMGTSLAPTGLEHSVTDRLRNSRSDFDRANFHRASYLFINNNKNYANAQMNAQNMNTFSRADGNQSEMYGNMNHNMNNMGMMGGNMNPAYQVDAMHPHFMNNQYRMQQNGMHMQGYPYYPQPPGVHPDFLNAIMHSQGPHANGNHMGMQGPNGTYGSGNGIYGSGPNARGFPGSAMEALAARYNSAASMQKRGEQGKSNQSEQRNDNKNEGGQKADSPAKKVRSKKEEEEGQMLLGFLQELQSNHNNASSNKNVPPGGQSTDATESSNPNSDDNQEEPDEGSPQKKIRREEPVNMGE